MATHFVKESILSFMGSLYTKNASSYWRMGRPFDSFFCDAEIDLLAGFRIGGAPLMSIAGQKPDDDDVAYNL